ncbi:uncharacterized protein H6S33_004896 [Morchella sextelata]|uniref:uncharacterized protein n=1 Tax=Morchella sextelata TaxID=1174677 RepID=UPI001D04BB88|nr:uncharacterized protein H6S33_004896 [Morchella sextelata]KAH0605674.1 hypothetical protein H6S33_004896 [Morchella sextelata]
MGKHQDLLSRSDIIALIIGAITIAINLIAINHLCRCYHRRKLHEQAVSNNANCNGTMTYTTTSAPPVPNISTNDHRESHPRPHRVDIESGLGSSRQNANHTLVSTAPNMQAVFAGAPNIQLVIPPLPQRPPPVQRKLEGEGSRRHGLSLHDNHRAPSVERDRRAVYAEQ